MNYKNHNFESNLYRSLPILSMKSLEIYFKKGFLKPVTFVKSLHWLNLHQFSNENNPIDF